MKKKTKHRILGALVVIGLVIILLPLFQGGKEIQTDTVLVTAPSFPDQPIQVASTIVEKKQATSSQEPSIPQTMVNTPSMAPQPQVIQTANTIKNNRAQQAHLIQSNVDAREMNPRASTQGENHAPLASLSPLEKPHRIENLAASRGVFDVNEGGLTKLKSAVWVIQIGSYKNKTNALRMVNQLRANGYRAFIQQIQTVLGEHTRVFVGPETKQASARALADRLQSEMHIQGIIINYKPLTL